jgi:hypothetical protein
MEVKNSQPSNETNNPVQTNTTVVVIQRQKQSPEKKSYGKTKKKREKMPFPLDTFYHA